MSVTRDIQALGLPDVFACPAPAERMTAEVFDSRRGAIRELLAREEYGAVPPPPEAIEFTEPRHIREYEFCGGHAELYTVMIKVTVGGESAKFPLRCVVPLAGRPVPAIVHINFSPLVPDWYMPSEELSDRGYAVFSLCYNEVTRDNGDFTDGVAPLFIKGERRGADAGKLSMWAWAAMRAMDYIETLGCIDMKNIAVAGHSRLGKAALWASANDERFAFAIANESGCGGASLSRGHIPESERIHNIVEAFPYWFCPNFAKYAHNEDALPFDQHFLLALIAPRGVAIGSADGDLWTDPVAQYRCCCEAAKVYELYGHRVGFTGPDRYPVAGEVFREGPIGYHIRDGRHFFSRQDWLRYLDYLDLHKN